MRGTPDQPTLDPTTAPALTPPGPGHVDVWSRTTSKYRIRAVVLLAVNVLLFAGVGVFAYWLRSGVVFAPLTAGYGDDLVDAFRFAGDRQVSLAAMLTEPISVLDVPMQIPIVGLLMSALIAIPILIAILYRFWASLPFIAVVGFLAVMPWLAITLLGSCVLATVRPFRTSFRFVSALLGLIPAVVYLFLAFSGTQGAVTGNVEPIDQIKFIAPWVLAIVAAAVLFAVVLTIAKIVDYRPGAVTPLLAVMFGLPVALFEVHVGRDELYYRVFENLDRWALQDRDTSRSFDIAVQRRYWDHPLPRPSFEAVRDIVALEWQFELASDLAPHRSALTSYVDELARKWDWFLEQFPQSRYALNACYFKARALDTRVDPDEYRRTRRWVRFYHNYPSQASRGTWRLIAENQPDTTMGSLALLRLAQLEAREGDIDRALDKVRRVIDRLERREPILGTAPDETEAGKGVLDRDRPEAGLNIATERVLLDAHWLYDLMRQNRDPLYGYEPLTGPRRATDERWFGMLDLVPRGEQYTRNLKRLEAYYPHCQIADNIQLEIAKATLELPARIDRLEGVLSRFPDRDAVPEALFRLSVAYKEAQRDARGDTVLDRLLTEHPDSIWARTAARYAPGTTMNRTMRAER